MVDITGLEDYEPDDSEEGSIYSPKSDFKKSVLAMEAVRACREARAKEMKKGFWNTKLDKQGNAFKTWQEDERKIFINSVIALEKLLSAECSEDETYKEFKNGEGEKDGIEKSIKAVFDKYAYHVFDFDSDSGGWKKTDQNFMPQIEEELLVPSVQDPRVLVGAKGGWDFKINAYYDELVPLYDKIFEELNKVIFRLNDFAEKFSEY